jgi:hypothetical protein
MRSISAIPPPDRGPLLYSGRRLVTAVLGQRGDSNSEGGYRAKLEIPVPNSSSL